MVTSSLSYYCLSTGAEGSSWHPVALGAAWSERWTLPKVPAWEITQGYGGPTCERLRNGSVLEWGTRHGFRVGWFSDWRRGLSLLRLAVNAGLSALVMAQEHAQFLNTSTPCTATRHLLCKLLLPSKWGRCDMHEYKWCKGELRWAQGAVSSSQASVVACTDFCLSDTTNVSARADGCLWALGEPDGSTWPSLVSMVTL